MLYKYGNSKIELLSKYLYEVSIYYISFDRAEMLSSKFISSNKEIRIKKEIEVENHKNKKTGQGYILEKSIVLLGAPQQFMDKYSLQKIE